MGCVFYKVPGHPFVICVITATGRVLFYKVPGDPFVLGDYGNGSGSYFFVVLINTISVIKYIIMYTYSKNYHLPPRLKVEIMR